jgi:uncharacterized protein
VGTPTRSCLVCRRTARKPDLVRLAVSHGAVVVDHPALLPGRGAYLCRRTECLDNGLRRGGGSILRALRARSGEVTIEEDRLREEWGSDREPAAAVVGGETA